MTTAKELIATLEDAKANLLTVEIKELDNGQILTTVSLDGFSYSEKFLADNLEYLVHRLKMVVDDYRLM